MKKPVFLASLLIALGLPVLAADSVREYSTTTAITGSVQTFDLSATPIYSARVVTVKTSATSSAIAVSLDGTDPTGKFKIEGNGAGMTFTQTAGMPDIVTVKVLGDSASGNVSIEARN